MSAPEVSTALVSSEPAAVAPPGVARGQRAANRALLIVRRMHLYLGLALAPFALLYGVTGFLFNHPRAFADVPITSVADAGDARLAPPDDLARAVTDELARSAPGKRLELAPGGARYEHAVAWRIESEGVDHLVIVDPAASGATVRTTTRAPDPPAPPFDLPARLGAGPDALAACTAAVGSVMVAAGLPAGPVMLRNVPDLLFELSVDGAPHRATYDLASGALTLRPPGAPKAPSTRAFLTRLHLTHGFPEQVGARWLWAIIVDLMSLALMLWALSGIAMWVPMRGLRRSGLVALAAGVLATVALGAAMFFTFIR